MFVIISSVPHTDFVYLTSRQSYRSRNPVSWIPLWFLPGSRVTVCFVLGVSPGQKATRRAYKFRFILSLSKNASPWNEDVLRGYAKADFIVIFFFLFFTPLPSFGTETPVASVSKDRCNFLLRRPPRRGAFGSGNSFNIQFFVIFVSTSLFPLCSHESDGDFRGHRGGRSL